MRLFFDTKKAPVKYPGATITTLLSDCLLFTLDVFDISSLLEGHIGILVSYLAKLVFLEDLPSINSSEGNGTAIIEFNSCIATTPTGFRNLDFYILYVA